MNGPALPYTLPVEEVLTTFAVDPKRGLRSQQITALRERYGFNELAEAPPPPLWRKFLAQFTDLVIWILIAAAVVSGFLGEWPDTIAILAIVLLNGILGFFQEERAEQALAALQKLSAPMAKVFRDGTLHSLPARELVPGDVLELEAGDNVPADARLFQAFGFRVQEAALTGESVPVGKDAGSVLGIATPLGDRRNMVYVGTVECRHAAVRSPSLRVRATLRVGVGSSLCPRSNSCHRHRSLKNHQAPTPQA
jgi:Ca2+-transporting ATPase